MDYRTDSAGKHFQLKLFDNKLDAYDIMPTYVNQIFVRFKKNSPMYLIISLALHFRPALLPAYMTKVMGYSSQAAVVFPSIAPGENDSMF
jgi:hypothetical protein